jgi:hypothetical protein
MDPINSGIVVGLIQAIGMTKTLFAVIILSCHFYIFRVYNARLQDRQNEINRLATENHDYRDKFSQLLLDNKFNNQNRG